MLVVDENTERKLLKLLDKFKRSGATSRAIHIRISHFGVQPMPMEELITLTQSIISDPTLQIYVLHDGDIMLMAETISARDARAYNELLAERMGQPENTEVSQFFEVEHSWNYLCYTVEEKYKAIQAEEKKRQAVQAEIERVHQRETIMGEEIPPEMVRSLPSRRAKHSRPVVMIVEDELFSRRLVEGALRTHCELISLGQGKGLMKQYLMAAPNIVFLDINLPDISGHDLLSLIFKIDPQAYVVMLSANRDNENILRATEQGARGFIGKPFSKDKLELHVKRSFTKH